MGGFNFASVSCNSAFIKLGPGKLAVELPAGYWSLSKANGSTEGPRVGCNVPPQGPPVPDPSGNWSDWSGLACLNILEGTIHLKGQGANKTYVNANTWNTMGDGYKSAYDPVLIVENLNLNTQNMGRHLLVGNGFDQGCASSPTFMLLNGAQNDTDTIRMGAFVADRSIPYSPTLIISNALVKVYWHLEVPDNYSQYDLMKAIVRCSGPRAKIYSYGSWADMATVSFGRTCDVLFENGARLEQVGEDACVGYTPTAKGQITFTSGAVMQMRALRGKNSTYDDSLVDLHFDGATMELTRSDFSIVAHVKGQGISIGENGMSILIPNGISHQVRIPLRGTGGVTKVGAGELVLGHTWEFVDDNHTNKNCDVITGSYEGKTIVKEGKLSVESGAMRDGMIYEVDPETILDLGGVDAAVTTCALSGKGTVSRAHVSAEIDLPANTDGTDQLHFQECALDGVLVDFNRLPTQPYNVGTILPVAVLDSATRFNPADWKGINVGKNRYAKFSQGDDGTVLAEIGSGGTVLVLK